MGRMIDVDALKKHIEEVIKKQNGKNTDFVPVGELMVFIDREPTAYDPDKVLDQLLDASFERFGCDTGMGGELVVNMDDVIEIVKAGGADAKTDS